jgi:DNA-binding LacI/PurR family transcriptional regulator
MANIKEVAKLAGVSTSTVSRTLSKKMHVEHETRERVMRAVRQLGYRPNLMAKGLKEGLSYTIALVVPDIINPFFPKLVKCVEKSALRRGYSLILCDSNGDEEQELRSLESLRSHYVDGILYIAVGEGQERARMLRAAEVPLVMVNRVYDAGVSCVTNDNREGARRVIDYLVECGHRRIACLATPADRAQHFAQRLEGVLEAFKWHQLRDCEQYLVRNIVTVEDAYLAAKRLLALPNPPTAFFTFIDYLTIGVYSGAHNCGMNVPEDVSVTGFDNLDIAAHMIPPLTTYEHPAEQIAERAVEDLLAAIAGEGGITTTVVPGSLIVRQSVKRIIHGED